MRLRQDHQDGQGGRTVKVVADGNHDGALAGVMATPELAALVCDAVNQLLSYDVPPDMATRAVRSLNLGDGG